MGALCSTHKSDRIVPFNYAVTPPPSLSPRRAARRAALETLATSISTTLKAISQNLESATPAVTKISKSAPPIQKQLSFHHRRTSSAIGISHRLQTAIRADIQAIDTAKPDETPLQKIDIESVKKSIATLQTKNRDLGESISHYQNST